MSRAKIPYEEWRPVVGFEGIYEVSNLGGIRRIQPASGTLANRILKPWVSNRGYPSVRLSTNGKGSSKTVHTIVTEAFIGPRPAGHQVNHLDGDKSNPALSNLAYVLPKENVRHALANGLHPSGERCGRAKLTTEQVTEIVDKYSEGRLSTQDLAKLYSVTETSIWAIISGKNWKRVTRIIERPKMTNSQAGRLGGRKTREVHGLACFVAMGAKGGRAVRDKLGRDFYVEIGRKGGLATKKS